MGQPPNDNRHDKSDYNAFIVSPNSICDPEWYFHSEASNHVTHDTNRFQEITESNGKNSLMVGNRENLKIMDSGSPE